MQDLHSEKIKGIGKELDVLYNLQHQKAKAKAATVYLHNDFAKEEDLRVWHGRLGHGPDRIVKKILNIKFKTSDDRIKKSTIRPLARQGRLSFSKSINISHKPFQLIHVDIWSPYRVSTHNHKFFLTIVNDCSRMIWIY